jgi:hypothetical protein
MWLKNDNLLFYCNTKQQYSGAPHGLNYKILFICYKRTKGIYINYFIYMIMNAIKSLHGKKNIIIAEEIIKKIENNKDINYNNIILQGGGFL